MPKEIAPVQSDGQQGLESLNVQLKEHVEDAQMLIAYASEQGLKVDEAVVANIVNSRYHLCNNTLDQEKEVKFWAAFDMLSRIIKPVSIDSLKATKICNSRRIQFRIFKYIWPPKISEAAHAIIIYQRLTVLVLALLLFTQIYWLIGSVIVNSVTQELPNQISELEDVKLSKLNMLLEKAKSLEQEEIHKSLTIISDSYDNKINDIKLSRAAYYNSLKTWRDFLRNERIFPKESKKEFLEKGYIEARQASQLILQPIQQYILPLLYGWLGALAYVLRNITREIRDITYTRESKERYRLRTQLGALSGLAVGWFLFVDPGTSESQSPLSFSVLSPLALSFMAGYSVELLFAAMDKIVEAFSISTHRQ